VAPGGQPPRRKKWPRWVRFGCLPVLGAFVLVVAALAGVIWYQKSHQTIERRPDGSVLPPPSATVTTPTAGLATGSCAVQQGLITRECGIVFPDNVASGEKLPVVFLLPGMGMGPYEVRGVGNWDSAAVAHRVMVVSPQGVSDSWNAGGCCGVANAIGVDDTGYLSTLVQEIAKRSDVDPNRMFMAGHSNGGMMAYRFLCTSVGERIRAVASVAGTRVANCAPKKPISVLHIHGTDDKVVPYDGGVSVGSLLLGVDFPSVRSSMDSFAADDGCTAAAQTSKTDIGSTVTWACGGSLNIRLDTIDGGNHDWPRSTQYDATSEILKFFGIT
jgi:polyhydroxybutyrate depolymerase